MPTDSPYIFDKGPGLVHIRRRVDGQCIADVRVDAYEIMREEIRREALAEFKAAVARAAIGGTG